MSCLVLVPCIYSQLHDFRPVALINIIGLGNVINFRWVPQCQSGLDAKWPELTLSGFTACPCDLLWWRRTDILKKVVSDTMPKLRSFNIFELEQNDAKNGREDGCCNHEEWKRTATGHSGKLQLRDPLVPHMSNFDSFSFSFQWEYIQLGHLCCQGMLD